MGMYCRFVAVSGDAPAELSSWSDDQLVALFGGPEAVNINKAWEAVFPLVGSIAGTGGMMVDEPIPIGGDLAYGPAMFIEPEQVRAIAGKLASADDATVEAHWTTLDSPFMQPGLYDDDLGKEFAMEAYRETVTLFVSAAAKSQGVLFAIM